MAKCSQCKMEMTLGVSCLSEMIEIDGKEYAPLIFDGDDGEFCPDCACPAGGVHHPGCDCEECPKCGGQLISCGCLEDEEEDEDEEY